MAETPISVMAVTPVIFKSSIRIQLMLNLLRYTLIAVIIIITVPFFITLVLSYMFFVAGIWALEGLGFRFKSLDLGI